MSTAPPTRTHTPMRTCVGCRGRAPAAQLWRFVARGGDLHFDARGGAAGRGAHLHPGCVDRASTRAFCRALRTQITTLDDALAQAQACEDARAVGQSTRADGQSTSADGSGAPRQDDPC